MYVKQILGNLRLTFINVESSGLNSQSCPLNRLQYFYGMETKDSNGTLLNNGDSVLIIKTLKVKGTSGSLDRGTVVKNIKLTDNNQEVEAKVNGSIIVLKAEFLKKR
jgi:protein PhnA